MKNVTYLIIFYGLICIFVMCFNIINILFKENKIKIKFNRNENFKKFIDNQREIFKTNKCLNEKDVCKLKSKLKEIDNLIFFHDYILKNLNYMNFNDYLKHIKNDLIELIYTYSQKNPLFRAYYFKFLRDFNLLSNFSNEKYEYILYNNLLDNNYYCRLNAFLTICNTTNPQKIIIALNTINNYDNMYYSVIIKSGFNTYKGNKNKFIKELNKNKLKYNNNIKLIIDEYILSVNKTSKSLKKDIIDKKDNYYNKDVIEENKKNEKKLDDIKHNKRIINALIIDFKNKKKGVI